jgi:hypothetical protein
MRRMKFPSIGYAALNLDRLRLSAPLFLVTVLLLSEER